LASIKKTVDGGLNNMSENSALACGHRNDLPHLITVLAKKLLVGVMLDLPKELAQDAHVLNAIISEFEASLALAFEKTGTPTPEIEGGRVFGEIKRERVAILEPIANEALARMRNADSQPVADV
jgi:hypothetical protein